jgi:hypothetical protein
MSGFAIDFIKVSVSPDYNPDSTKIGTLGLIEFHDRNIHAGHWHSIDKWQPPKDPENEKTCFFARSFEDCRLVSAKPINNTFFKCWPNMTESYLSKLKCRTSKGTEGAFLFNMAPVLVSCAEQAYFNYKSELNDDQPNMIAWHALYTNPIQYQSKQLKINDPLEKVYEDLYTSNGKMYFFALVEKQSWEMLSLLKKYDCLIIRDPKI